MPTRNPELEALHAELAAQGAVAMMLQHPDLHEHAAKGKVVLVAEREAIPEDVLPYIPEGAVVALLAERPLVARCMERAGHGTQARMFLMDDTAPVAGSVPLAVVVGGLLTITAATPQVATDGTEATDPAVAPAAP